MFSFIYKYIFVDNVLPDTHPVGRLSSIFIGKCMHMHIQTRTYTDTNYTPPSRPPHRRMLMHTHTCTRTHTHIYTQTHTHTHTHTHVHTHAHTHAYIHTHAP